MEALIADDLCGNTTTERAVVPRLRSERSGLSHVPGRAGGRSLLTPESGRELGADADARVSSLAGVRSAAAETTATRRAVARRSMRLLGPAVLGRMEGGSGPLAVSLALTQERSHPAITL
jgi:hypothetical protein